MAAGLLLLAAVIVVGWLASQALRGQERYQIAFGDIDCTPPPHLSRDFPGGGAVLRPDLPDAVCVLDDGLPARLSAAFAKHPWVEQVESVEIVAPNRVRVRLIYRTAVLRVQGEMGRSMRTACVCRRRRVDESRPALHGDVPPPAGQEGQPWGDERVQGAARTAALLARIRIVLICASWR